MREISVIEIDLSAICHNVSVLRRMIGASCRLCPVVKADAYGLGAVRVAQVLSQARAGVGSGADMLAVYTPAQAAELFTSAVATPVLVLMPVREIGRRDDLYRALVSGRLHLAVHDERHLDDLVRITERYATPIPVHLEIDTGMSRGGCNLEQAPRVLARIADEPRLNLAGVFTHCAAAEADPTFTDWQFEQFDAFLEYHRAMIPSECLIHAANTCATLRNRSYHKSMVRVGQGWAGYGPEMLAGGQTLAEADHLQPCVTWASEIVHMKNVSKGATVGYGATWTAARDSVIGLVPVGYADGYPFALSGRSECATPARVTVCIDGDDGATPRYAPVVGLVNMDQITIDLTDVVSANDSSRASVGTRVELISPDRSAPNHLVTLARQAGTTPYEFMCGLSPRHRRVYSRRETGIEIMAGGAVLAAG